MNARLKRAAQDKVEKEIHNQDEIINVKWKGFRVL